MALSEQDRELIDAFHGYVEGAVAADDRYGPAERCEREGGLWQSLRFEAGQSCWLEVQVRPTDPQVRVAFLTNDRWRSEEVEESIQASGDTMSRFVAVAFAEAGLNCPEPEVEHYRGNDEYYYFATPLVVEEFEDLGDLERGVVRDKVVRMLEGYLVAFGPAIDEEEEDPDEDWGDE